MNVLDSTHDLNKGPRTFTLRTESSIGPEFHHLSKTLTLDIFHY